MIARVVQSEDACLFDFSPEPQNLNLSLHCRRPRHHSAPTSSRYSQSHSMDHHPNNPLQGTITGYTFTVAHPPRPTRRSDNTASAPPTSNPKPMVHPSRNPLQNHLHLPINQPQPPEPLTRRNTPFNRLSGASQDGLLGASPRAQWRTPRLDLWQQRP